MPERKSVAEFVTYADGVWTVKGERAIEMIGAIRLLRYHYHVGLAEAKQIAEMARQEDSPEMHAAATLERKRAAAPDLYAALEAAIPLLIRLGDFIGNKESRCEAILAARHALAKADGRDA